MSGIRADGAKWHRRHDVDMDIASRQGIAAIGGTSWMVADWGHIAHFFEQRPVAFLPKGSRGADHIRSTGDS